MNIPSQYLAEILSYGYTRTEAEFVYLVAMHSGYFTQSQFLRYAHAERGGSGTRFTDKVLRLGHGRATRYAYNTLVFNLYSHLIYGRIGKDNPRNRRRLSHDLVRTRLLILDFILEHLEHQYLETEADKLHYFHDKLHIALSTLPGRIYRGIRSNSNSKRYFVDRFPVFIPCGPNSLFAPLAPTFVYCDNAGPSLLRFIRHLRTYEPLLLVLSAFNFVYAAPNDVKFKRAAMSFSRVFLYDTSNPDHLARYFQIRQAWEDHKTGALTRADRQLLRSGDRHFRGENFEDAYRRWVERGLASHELKAVLCSSMAHENRQFSTYILPSQHDILERFSKNYKKDEAETMPRNRRSRASFSLALPPVPPNAASRKKPKSTRNPPNTSTTQPTEPIAEAG
jgi:hypothetical protein